MTVKEAIEREKLYFSTHPVYSTMPANSIGTDTLTHKLTKVLFTHIKHNLPEITKEIKEKISGRKLLSNQTTYVTASLKCTIH